MGNIPIGELESWKARSRLSPADSGIGKAVAIAFAREGADILISYLSEDEDAADTAKWVKEAGRNAVVAAGDIKSEDHCKALVQRAVDELGRLDILGLKPIDRVDLA